MSFSSVSVVTNALRLKLFKPSVSAPAAPAAPAAPKAEAPACQAAACAVCPAACEAAEPAPAPAGHCRPCDAGGRHELCSLLCPGGEGSLRRGCVESAHVDLEAKTAAITLAHPVEDSVLEAAVIEAGYTPISISDTIDSNNKGEFAMNKKIVIDGMMCMHCAVRWRRL